MYMLYVDESGDIGRKAGSTPYFVLSGFVVHELNWHSTLESIIQFRQQLRARYGLKLREKIHAAQFLFHAGALARIRKDLRLRILREVLDFQASLQGVNLVHIVVIKSGKPLQYDIFDKAWMTLIQRFENTINHKNFPGPQNPQDFGVLFVDKTDEKKLRLLARRLRPIQSRAACGS